MDVFWVKSEKGLFYNFLNPDPAEAELMGKAGVFVLWHAGLMPEWVYIGRTKDLGQNFEDLRANREIMSFDRQGNLFVTWSEIKPEYQEGVVQYLLQVIPPIIPNPNPPDEDEPAIAVFPPGVQVPPPANT